MLYASKVVRASSSEILKYLPYYSEDLQSTIKRQVKKTVGKKEVVFVAVVSEKLDDLIRRYQFNKKAVELLITQAKDILVPSCREKLFKQRIKQLVE